MEREGGRRSYAEGVETERGRRERELKVFESFESLRCICVHFKFQLELVLVPIADVASVAKI